MVSLLPLRPDVVWSAKRANEAHGREGQAYCNLDDLDMVPMEPFTVWDPARLQFVEQPRSDQWYSIGPAGHFIHGIHGYWNNNDQTTKGLTLSSLGSGYVETYALPVDHIVSAAGVTNGMRVHGDASQVGLIEGPEDRSTSYDRVWQVLIRRTDGGDVEADGVFPYVSSQQLDLAFRVDNGQRFVCKVPGRTDGWYWMWTVVPADPTPAAFFGVSIPAGQAHAYEIEAPCTWNIYSTHTNMPQPPILNTTTGSNQRGQPLVHLGFGNSTGCPCPVNGFVAMAFTLPYAKATYKDFDGQPATWPDGSLLQWTSGIGDDGVRVAISSTWGLAAWIQVAATYPVYLHGVGDWNAFEPIGLVFRWEQLDGNFVAELYVNGRKCDDVYLSSSVPLDPVPAGELVIGSKTDGSHVADAWIEQVAAGRHRISQDEARELSLLLHHLCLVREDGLL